MAYPPSLCSQITITSSNKYLDIDNGAGGDDNFVLTEGTYADIWAVCTELQTQLQAGGGIYAAATVEITHATTVPGRIEITIGASRAILFATGTNTGSTCGSILGFDVSADASATTTHRSDYQHQYGWNALRYPHRYGPLKPKQIGGEPVTTLSGKNEKVVHIGFHNFYEVGLVILEPELVFSAEATGANINRDLETVWKDAIQGNAVRWREDQSVSGTYTDFYLQEPRTLEELTRKFDDYEAYDILLKFRRKEA